MPFQIVLVTYKNRLPSRFEIRVSFWSGYRSRFQDIKRPFFMKKYIPYFLLLLLAGGIVSKAILGLDSGHQHDFISYYYGAKSIIMGLNGYDSHIVSTMSGQGHQSHLRFVYPPQMAWVFAPLTAFSFLHARLIFLCIKLITATGFIALYLKFFVKEKHLLSFVLISLFAFRGPFTSDILAGNIATFEILLLWLGFLFLVMGRSYLFALFIALAGSFKLLPLAFLADLPKNPKYKSRLKKPTFVATNM